MESRGIYMSADWAAAEPFAKNLIRQLGELQDVARAWMVDAIASQQSNIEQLTGGLINSCASAPNWYGLAEKRVQSGCPNVRRQ